MTTTLYDLSVASYLQTAKAVAAFLDRGLKHCETTGSDPEAIVATRLFDDMAPFSFQINSVAHHSRGAIKGVEAGHFGPPTMTSDTSYKGLQALIAETIAGLEALSPETVNAHAGGAVEFRLGDMKIPFTTENFILSFSLPNFHFHATTAYDILRMKGVPLGKRNYLGQMRMAA